MCAISNRVVLDLFITFLKQSIYYRGSYKTCYLAYFMLLVDIDDYYLHVKYIEKPDNDLLLV